MNHGIILLSLLLLLATPMLAQVRDDSRLLVERRERFEERLREMMREKVRVDQPVRHDGSTQLLDAPAEASVRPTAEQEGEIHAIINPTDSANIVASAIRSVDGGFTLPVFVTTDFGVTWTESPFAPGATGGGDPVFAAGPDGTLYFSWIELVLGGGPFPEAAMLLMSRSTDKGITWSGRDTIYPDYRVAGSGTSHFADKQWMAVDLSGSPRRGILYVVYVEMEMSGWQFSTALTLRQYIPGQGFAAEGTRILADQPGENAFAEFQFAGIGVDDIGTVHVIFWGRRTESERHGVWHTRSEDGGVTFSTPVRVADVRFPGLQQENIPDHLPQRLAPFPQLAVDGFATSPHRGSLYLVWCANRGDGDVGSFNDPFENYFSCSSDRGTTWSAPRRVADDDSTAERNHFLPSVDVTPDGVVAMTWYDGREDRRNTRMHHYATFSFDGGRTLAPNRRVSGAPSNMEMDLQGSFGIGDYTRVVTTRGYAIPFWSDGRGNDGNLDVYAAFVPITQSPSGVDRIIEVGGSGIAIAPNVVSSSAMVQFNLARAGHARIDVVDLRGNVVRLVFDGSAEAGTHRIALDCADFAAGRYLVRLHDGAGTRSAELEIAR